MNRISWVAFVAGLLLSVSVVAAGEVEELRERAGDLKRRAVELMGQGEKEAANRLLREAAELGERAQKLAQEEKALRTKPRPALEQRERELQNLHARLKELHLAHRALWDGEAPEPEILDIRRRIQHVDGLIALREGRVTSDALHRLEAQFHQIQHLRNAAEHLQAADMPDLARSLREKSVQMERAAKERLELLEQEAARLPSPPPPETTSVEDALRKEVQALRHEIEKLRQQRQP